MNQLIFTFSKWLILPLLAILVGCAQKPPSCADERTIATIKNIIVTSMEEKAANFVPPAEDPQNIIGKAINGLKVEMKNVVSQGYEDKARRYYCRGSMVVTEVSGDTLTWDIVYMSQATEGKGSSSIVEVQGVAQYVLQLDGNLRLNYYKKRYAGEWVGTYSCSGINGETDGLQGPFSKPVVLVVEKNTLRATMERTTLGGGIEKLTGQAGVKMQLAGKGRNGADDSWDTQFNGGVSGMQFTANGNISIEGNRIIRACTLKLDLPSNL